ncbi:hypothetical protein U1R68_09495 [Pectobacterium colocasium]|uniref:hypothetical protein n=1 Tax=Pectobacterium colocasium TaxID=2878098 RepID=UPI003305F190
MLNSYDEDKERIWRNYAVWAEEKQDGIALTNAESFLMINSMQRSDELDLKKVIAFNPLIQKGRFLWAKKNYYTQQIQCITDLKAYKTNTEILNTVFDGQSNDFVYKSNNILRSLPPLEFIMDPMYVRKNVVEGSLSDNHFLIAMYTYNNYYSGQRNRRNHIFFSRAFEVLFWSCLIITENLPEYFMDENLFHKCFKNIFYRVPFYSSFSFNSTKVIDESNDGDGDDLERSIEYANSIDSFISTLYEWCKENKFSELKGENIIPLFSLVFNKVFTQLKILRSNILTDRKSFNDEHLSDLAKRFEYIFINALISFVRDGAIIHANVATGAKSSSVRNFDEFSKYDRTLYRNLSGIIVDKKEYSSIEIGFRLINIISEHPLFSFGDATFYPIGEVRSTVEQVSDDVDFNEMNFRGIRSFYYSASGKKTIRTSEVRQWAEENPDVARKIHSRMKNDGEMSLDIYGGGQISWMFAGLSYGLGIEY